MRAVGPATQGFQELVQRAPFRGPANRCVRWSSDGTAFAAWRCVRLGRRGGSPPRQSAELAARSGARYPGGRRRLRHPATQGIRPGVPRARHPDVDNRLRDSARRRGVGGPDADADRAPRAKGRRHGCRTGRFATGHCAPSTAYVNVWKSGSGSANSTKRGARPLSKCSERPLPYAPCLASRCPALCRRRTRRSRRATCWRRPDAISSERNSLYPAFPDKAGPTFVTFRGPRDGGDRDRGRPRRRRHAGHRVDVSVRPATGALFSRRCRRRRLRLQA